MKMIAYSLSILDKHFRVVMREAMGEPVGKFFAVRQSFDLDKETRYVIDHVPTGYAIAFSDTKIHAVRAARAISNCGADWENIDPRNMTEQQLHLGRVVLTDLSMDGLIYSTPEKLQERVSKLKATGWEHTCYNDRHK